MSEPEIPMIPAFDDRAVRRAMWRGVARAGLVAAVALGLMGALLVTVSGAISSVRGSHFHLVAVNGMVVAHPEYEIQQAGSCCASGPLFGVTNLGLASEVTLRVRPMGALNYAGTSLVTVSRGAGGGLRAELDASRTPLGEALRRSRPSNVSTQKILDGLPESTVVSALIELRNPVDSTAFQSFFDAAVPVTDVPNRGVPVFLIEPYAPSSTNPISWRGPQLDELRTWAGQLSGDDDGALASIGLPSSAEIKRTVDEGRIHAFVVSRMSLALARSLLADPAVRSVNILDVAFDVSGHAG